MPLHISFETLLFNSCKGGFYGFIMKDLIPLKVEVSSLIYSSEAMVCKMFTIGGELCVNAMKWYGSIPASFTFIRKEPLFLFTLFIILRLSINNQKQLAKGVLSKSCSENMQQIYKRTTLLKSHFGMGVLL